jgi:teichoic acid transport system permease protein
VSDDQRPGRSRAGGRGGTRAADRATLRAEGRLSAPGRLVQGENLTVGGVLTADMPAEPLAEYAASHGLRPSASRPPVLTYLRQLWHRWSFIMAFATARNIAMYTEARLGQLWQVLTPLLNVAVYYLIFGIILDTSRGIPDFISFLVVGVFVFNFTQRAFISSSKVITDSLPLIRALQFPRAALPIAYVMIEFQQMLLSMGVLFVIILVRGEPITWYWLLTIPVLLLQTIFNVGVGLLVARLGSQVNDFSQLLPFLLRTWMYMSGVMFSIATLTQIPSKFKAILQLNPAALYITLMRNALLITQRQSFPGSKPGNARLCNEWHHYGKLQPKALMYNSAHCPATANPGHFWYYAIGWAVLAMVIGFFFFWRAEAKYGRG